MISVVQDSFGRRRVVLDFCDLSDEPSKGLDKTDDIAEDETRLGWRDVAEERDEGDAKGKQVLGDTKGVVSRRKKGSGGRGEITYSEKVDSRPKPSLDRNRHHVRAILYDHGEP
jgi:hypothetical protein